MMTMTSVVKRSITWREFYMKMRKPFIGNVSVVEQKDGSTLMNDLPKFEYVVRNVEGEVVFQNQR